MLQVKIMFFLNAAIIVNYHAKSRAAGGVLFFSLAKNLMEKYSMRWTDDFLIVLFYMWLIFMYCFILV